MSTYLLLTESTCAHRFEELGLKAHAQDRGLSHFLLQKEQRTAAFKALQLTVTQERHTCICLPLRRWQAAFFDMDSTVIAEESIVELAAAAGKAKEVQELTERAMAGELDFATALRTRVASLAGLPLSTMHDLAGRLTINPGMHSFAQAARQAGIKLYLVSGGFRSFAATIVQELQFDGYLANELEHDGQALTGRLLGPLIDAEAKAEFLLKTTASLQIPLENCMVVGDGANDLPMLRRAGAAIGYHPKAVLLPEIDGANYHDHSLLVDYLRSS